MATLSGGSQAYHPFITEHADFQYFVTTESLNKRQARWAEELVEINYKLIHRLGTKGGKPDTLTRRL